MKIYPWPLSNIPPFKIINDAFESISGNEENKNKKSKKVE